MHIDSHALNRSVSQSHITGLSKTTSKA